MEGLAVAPEIDPSIVLLPATISPGSKSLYSNFNLTYLKFNLNLFKI